MKQEKSRYEAALELARECRPFGEPSAFGFETRLRASLSEAFPSSAEMLARLSWRFTFACFPVLVISALFVGIQNSGFLPEGIGGVVSQWTMLLPVNL